MLRFLTLCVALAALPALAEEVNLSTRQQAGTGSAAQLVLAQRAYDHALREGDVLALLSAIRLARGVTVRPATGWEKAPADPPPGDAPQGAPAGPDPASPAALDIARNLAGEEPDLQDLVYDLDAQGLAAPVGTAVEVRSDLGPGQSESWSLPLFGEVAAELGLIGDGDGPLALTLADDTGAILCHTSASTDPSLCRLTPARNGFFTLTVRNDGASINSYRLVGN